MGYVELETLKSTLSLAGETFVDDDLQLGIDSATEIVDSICGRVFLQDPVTGTASKLYVPVRDDAVLIDDLTELTSIESSLAGSTDWVTWEEDEFELHPLNAEGDGSPWTEIKLPRFSIRIPLSGNRQIRVTGQWGWTAVPVVVKQATGILAARLVKRSREAPLGVAAIGADAVAMRISRTDPDVEQLLASYMRPIRLA